MNLVDILAGELKEWPEQFGGYAISARAESSYAVWFNDRKPVRINDGWSDIGCVELWLTEKPADQKSAIVTRAQWQAAVDALKAGEQTWDGEGLPPVGTVCLVEHPAQASRKVKILAHWKDGLSVEVACYMPLEGQPHCDQAIVDCFRPIRTAEQIAAEEHEAEVAEMINLAVEGHQAVTIAQARILCTQLHKAGYRKQVQP